MKFPSNKIEAAVSSEATRYTIQAVKLDVEKKKLIATDGHIMAVVPCTVDENDHSGLIGVDAVKLIRDITKRQKYGQPTVNVNGKIEIVGANETATAIPVEGSFPNWEAVVPKFEATEKNRRVLETLEAMAKNLDAQIDATNVHEKKVALDDLREDVLKSISHVGATICNATKPTISFDVNLLVRLVDALKSEQSKGKNGHKRVSLWIKSADDAIVVKSTASEDSESIGVMMPVRA